LVEGIGQFAPEIDVNYGQVKFLLGRQPMRINRCGAGPITSALSTSRSDFMALATCQWSSTTRTRAPGKSERGTFPVRRAPDKDASSRKRQRTAVPILKRSERCRRRSRTRCP
jgi:hypothetical protein